jgi:anaphase-promoting complex subunit 1
MPAALQYLVAESVLHEDSTESDYTWDTYHDNSTDAHIDDVVTTEYHVVWSRGGVVRKCFNFEIEQERVIQALLTWFPVEEPTTSASQSSQSEVYTKTESQNSFLTQGTQPATDPNASPPRSPRVVEGRARALVVFLKTQAHVFFLSGSTHIVHLPFEVERAFPAARGVLLQRKRPPPHVAVPPSPPLPSAPPNSFLSNPQSFLAQSFSQSFSQSLSQPVHRHDRSLSSTRQTKPLKPGSANALFLQELAKSTALTSTDGLPRLFSFTDPLSELGLVVNVVPGERGGFLTTNSSGHRRLEPIDRDEEIIYVSPQNEIQFDRSGNDKPLLIVVTANYETNVFTIWSAAYLEPKSISASRKNHTSHSSNKVRRRSSYGPTVPGTGATTPAVRGSDRMRESFGGVIRNRLNPTSFSASSQPKERLSDEAVEEALASQLNPDSELSRQPKEHRRISGALSRAELSNSFDKSAFQDLATHRTSLGGSFNASFGASQRSRRSLGNDRLSFGGFPRPRNRASTPGSVTSRVSVGGASMDDTLEDIMDEDTLDTLEDYDELDDLFSPPDAGFEQEPLDGLRKELVLTPVAELSTEKYLRPELSSMRDSATSDQVRSSFPPESVSHFH